MNTAPLAETLSAWAAAWESCAPARVLALWDRSDGQCWYLPADSVEAHVGSAVVGVIQRRCVGLQSARYKPAHVQLRLLSADVGLAFFQLEWVRAYAQASTTGGHVRVTMLMRKVENVWRVFHYAEAPLAPLLELQGFYERVAAEGFGTMPVRP
ncbi:MAG: nuclear transport factor 2 family protein [Rhodospirillaceae bacterium]|nr:nuclear transport factor 2 family protein [Rhodospirillaceae bacterium]